jgi:hypothetical protein
MNERRFTHTPEEARKLWGEALRSGEFCQTRYVLHRLKPDAYGRPAGHCCLGVACEVFALNEAPLVREEERDIEFYEGQGNVLPRVVGDWLGLASDAGRHLVDFDHEKTLDYLNDEDCLPFPAIADIIESAPPGLFVEPQATEAR